MTNDEKAKAYDDALERARKIHNEIINNEIIGFPGQIIEIFPQLRESESEDERIRKEIINFLRSPFVTENITDEKIAPWLAYLEKQKYDRMRPIYDARESFESALEKAWNDYHNGYENVDKLEDDYVECAHAKGFREGYLFGIEKQKEQKPADGKDYSSPECGTTAGVWSEEDENKIESIKGLITMGRFADTNTIRTIWELLDSLRPSWKPSEEQIYSLGTVVNGIGEASVGSIGYNLKELYGHLKKLI